MIGVLIATKSEAYFLLKHTSATKKDGIYHYRGQIAGRNLAVYLTRPGVAAKEQLRRFLRLYTFDAVISTGSCGNLTSELKRHDVVHVAVATYPGKIMIPLLAAKGRTCVSVPHLVTEDRVKADLRAQTGADILDMETYTIAGIFAEREFMPLRWVAMRVVDDLPGEENYLLKEKILRDMTAATPSGKAKWNDIWRFGIWDYFRITLRRHAIARAIFTATEKQITDLRD